MEIYFILADLLVQIAAQRTAASLTHTTYSVTNDQFKLYPICSDSGVEHEHFIGRPNEI